MERKFNIEVWERGIGPGGADRRFATVEVGLAFDVAWHAARWGNNLLSWIRFDRWGMMLVPVGRAYFVVANQE
jgi:hypothetical protein